MVIHQLRVCPCPDLLPSGFYWYGSKRRSPGRTPAWLSRLLGSSPGNRPVDETEPVGTSSETGAETPTSATVENQSTTDNQEESWEQYLDEDDVAMDRESERTVDPDGDIGANESRKSQPQVADQVRVDQSAQGPIDVTRSTRSTATSHYPLRDRRERRGPDRLMRVMMDAVRDELN